VVASPSAEAATFDGRVTCPFHPAGDIGVLMLGARRPPRSTTASPVSYGSAWRLAGTVRHRLAFGHLPANVHLGAIVASSSSMNVVEPVRDLAERLRLSG